MEEKGIKEAAAFLKKSGAKNFRPSGAWAVARTSAWLTAIGGGGPTGTGSKNFLKKEPLA
jgi:hypothetical protein